MYDHNNIFARILRGEIPAKKISENDFYLSFHDISPKAPIHALCIPKGPHITFSDLMTDASPELILGFHKGIFETIKLLDLTGYKLASNNGKKGNQEVPHYHVHITGGF